MKVKPVAKELPLTGNHETQDVVVVEVPRERLSIALKAECSNPSTSSCLMVREMVFTFVFSNYLKKGACRLVKNCHFLGDKKSYLLKRMENVFRT